jgi:hypothetical protein
MKELGGDCRGARPVTQIDFTKGKRRNLRGAKQWRDLRRTEINRRSPDKSCRLARCEDCRWDCQKTQRSSAEIPGIEDSRYVPTIQECGNEEVHQ